MGLATSIRLRRGPEQGAGVFFRSCKSFGRWGSFGWMRTADFDFAVPSELVAQAPAGRRDESRLLVLHRNSGKTEHLGFGNVIDYLRPGDVLVLNNSRVIPARLRRSEEHTSELQSQ